MACGWIFAHIIWNGRSTKVAKIIAIHWHLTFLQRGQVCFCMHLYGPHTFVWKKCWEFQMAFPLKPSGQCCSNFMRSLLGQENESSRLTCRWKIAKRCWLEIQNGSRLENWFLTSPPKLLGDLSWKLHCSNRMTCWGKIAKIVLIRNPWLCSY